MIYWGGVPSESVLMPHSPEEKRKAIARLRRIQGQAAAIERAIEAGTECAPVLQQIAAMRGAVSGLMREVLESHLRETFGPIAQAEGADAPDPALEQSIEHAVNLVHTYLR